MTTTRPQARALLYLSEIDGLGLASTATDIDADGIDDPYWYQNSEDGEGQWEGAAIYRPSETGDDRVKIAGAVDTSIGKLAQVGSSYVNQTTGFAYELIGLVSPDELNECIRKGNRRCTFYTRAPVTMWPDGDFTADSITAWTANDQALGTSSYDITAASNYEGYSSLKLTATGATYTKTQQVAVTPLEKIWDAVIAKVNGSYSGYYELWDVTHGTIITGDDGVSRWTFSDRAFQHYGRTVTIPSGCYLIEARLGANAAGVVIFDSLPSHPISDRSWTMASWIDQPWKLLSLAKAEYGFTSSTTYRQQSARSRDYFDLINPSDYSADIQANAANPSVLQWNGGDRRDDPPDCDLWYEGRRSWGDRAELDDETTATGTPEEELLAGSKLELSLILRYRYKDDFALYRDMGDACELVLAGQRVSKPPQPQRREVGMYSPGARGSMGY